RHTRFSRDWSSDVCSSDLKMAGYIGYRVAGVLGMINAVLATIVPTIIMMIILLTFLSSMKDQPWVQGMTRAVVPVVCVMLATLRSEERRVGKECRYRGGRE